MIGAAQPRRSMLLLGLILICAAVVRIGWPGIAEFKYDEAMISRRAIGLAQQGIWPASTISSIPGIPQPAMKALLLAIPYAFTRNPMAAVAFQGLLGTITVALAYFIGKTYFSQRAGLVAAAVLALTPWALFYDRKLWSQNVPLITTLMILGLLQLIVQRRRWGLALACGAVGLLIGFYLGNAILAGVVVLALACFPRIVLFPQSGESRWRPLLWALGALVLLAVTLIPYAIDLSRKQASPSAVSQAVSENAPRAFDPWGQVEMSAQVATGYDFHALAGDKVQAFYASLPLPDLNGPLDGAALGVIVVAMAYVALRALVEALRGRRGALTDDERASRVAPYALLALWIVVPIAAWTAFRQQPYPHRYIMAYPSQALALGVLLADAWRWAESRWPRFRAIPAALVVVAIAVLSVWHLVVYFGMLRFVSTTPINGGHGAPVERLWAAASEARSLSGDARLPIIIHTSGDDPEYQGGAAEFDAVLGDLPIYLIRTPGMEALPTRDYVWISDRGSGNYTVERRSAVRTSTAAGLARQANGIDLLSVDPAALAHDPIAGSNQTIALTWRVWNPSPSGLDYGYTVQLYGANGPSLGQVDSPFLRSPFWRVGDTITTRVELPIHAGAAIAGPFQLVVAMYAYVSESKIDPVNILDVAGNPAGQQIIITLK